ncbi:hypothetical protein RQM47_02635 [Rubrivirga sp. S365]|uniref:MmgE/PrpD family protein n=1 Tax=Rubrivirga litoralis TaxID=3075598 RepID=A0ABU3BQB8_9BACT|nr:MULTISPECIES: hypothetical protein [unclassified Rubrivirga]MDT0631484.1 hypothetical protein [Rubrivirga sp. F394]MDT7855533.1 hypothetical protein [Rubrivirga sp. S365]
MTTATAPRRSAHAALLAGYIVGAVTDEAMSQFDTLFEDTAATADERHAFALFFLDAVQTGDIENAVPTTAAEAAGILVAARA